ncbi:MAG TPA: PVC-type heme-binding CxxCH protein [Verrucomicrobiales bacterium]|nr:PVC-type heme-binding CxxCH protein [Verrucomicrobiales bacterium]
MATSLGFLLSLGAVQQVRTAAEPEADPEHLPRVAPLEPEAALEAFQVRDGFRVELAAAEPLVTDPVALCFDAGGSLYVVEMRGYSERKEERLGRVRRLRDEDGDGFYEESLVWAEDLAWPTAIACWRDGVFVADSPDLIYLRDNDGDGKADQRKRVWTGFGEGQDRVNVQGLPNNLRWGPEGRMHGATSVNGARLQGPGEEGKVQLLLRGDDFSFDPSGVDARRESGGGQHGLAFDDWGRKYVCHNSRHLELIMAAARYGRGRAGRLPASRVGIAADGPAAEVYRISADEPWRVMRTRWRVAGLVDGPVEGGGRVSGYFTSASGLEVYRGDLFPPEYWGNVFVGDVGSNLVHRKVIRATPGSPLPEARRARDEGQSEFLASTDNWFRPVQCVNGPEGALYIVDMYREIIEHPWSLPESIKKHLDLNSGNDRGRIYRVVPEGLRAAKSERLDRLGIEDLVRRLGSGKSWERETAARLLLEAGRGEAAEMARRAFTAGEVSSLGIRQALAVLGNLGELNHADLLAASSSGDPLAVLPALEWSETLTGLPEAWRNRLEEWASHPDPGLRFQLALTLSLQDLIFDPEWDLWREELVRALLDAGGDQEWMPPALSALAAGVEHRVLEDMLNLGREAWDPFLLAVGRILAGEAAGGDDVVSRNVLARILGEAALEGCSPAWACLGEWVRTLESSGADARDTFEEGQRKQLIGAGREQLIAMSAKPAAVEIWTVLAFLGGTDPEMIKNLLTPVHGESLQRAVMAYLERRSAQEAAGAIADAWAGLSPGLRTAALDLLMARPERAQLLLETVRAGGIPKADISARARLFLEEHADEEVRELAATLWTGGGMEAGEAAFTRLEAALTLDGDAAVGKRIYRERCAACHRAGEEGSNFGPDLAVMRRAGREKILLSVVDPSREVPLEYMAYQVETTAGDTLLGILARETEERIELRLPGGLERSVERTELRSLRSLGISAMPPGLCEDLDAEEVAGLLKFVESEPGATP